MLPDDFKAVCSVTEMAKKVGLSRVRFYQLLTKDVFPKPLNFGSPKRSFYPLDLQQKCIEIRKTGIGYNGQPVIFNTPGKKRAKKPQNQPDHRYEPFATILRQLGLNVTHINVKDAVSTLYPEGLAQHPDEGVVLRNLFNYFRKGL